MTIKAENLKHWKDLEKNQNILKHFEPIPYKAKGSRYGACGIRIDGSPQFIDAVLSRLTDLIAGENHLTRLELARSKVDGSKLGKKFENQTDDAECCYIRLHVRGGEAQRASAFFDKHLTAPTHEFLDNGGQHF